MTVPCQDVCTSWATVAQARACSDCPDEATISDDDLSDWLVVASDLLYELTGRRWPGACSETVRPCLQCQAGDWPYHPSHHAGRHTLDEVSGFSLDGTPWSPPRCRCNTADVCGCRLSAVRLGAEPVIEVTQVLVDGVALDSARYEVRDWRWLVRLPDADGTNPGWPAAQDLELATTEENTWEVTYSYGATPPTAGQRAAAEYGCHLALGCLGSDECRLPPNVQSVARQGIDIVLNTPTDLVTNGLTGLGGVVDQFIAAYNPRGLQRRARVFSPQRWSRPVTRATG